MASPAEPRVRLAALLCTLALTLGTGISACGGSSSGSDADGGESGSKAKTEIEGLVRPEPLQVGDLSLPEASADGEPFAFAAAPGQLLFVAFGYTNCPDVCPTTLYDIKKARKKLGADGEKVDVAFATVDPKRDTATVITEYLHSFAKDGHALRTEDAAAFKQVEDGFGVTSQVKENADGSTDVAHTARSFVVNDQGEVVVEWAFGTGADVMASDLQLLLAQNAKTS